MSLIACWNAGYAWLPAKMEHLTNMVPVHAIYGNHNNFDIIQSVVNYDGIRILVKDGEIRMIVGLKVASSTELLKGMEG